MRYLLDKFVDRCVVLKSIANGYGSISSGSPLDRALEEHSKILSVFYAAQTGTPKQQENYRQLLDQFEASLQSYLSNKNTVLEIFHAHYIQAWFAFLDDLFEKLLEKHFSGEHTYQIKKLGAVRVSFDKGDTPDSILRNVQQSAWELFSNNVESMKKVSIIEQALEKELTSELKKNIKKHIIVRNLLQHNQGELRTRDLKQLGDSKFKYPCARGEEQGDYYSPNEFRDYRMKLYAVGDTVEIDATVLSRIHYDLVEAAQILLEA